MNHMEFRSKTLLSLNISVQEIQFFIASKSLAWVLCHFVGGTPITASGTQETWDELNAITVFYYY